MKRLVTRRAGKALLTGGRARGSIGLAIDSDSIRAVSVLAGAIEWALETAIVSDGESLSAQIISLLSRAPASRASWTRRTVVAAVGPGLVQTRRLNGLPPTDGARMVSQLVREGTSRFFLSGSGPLVVSDVHVDATGGTWAAAFEAPIIDAIQLACRARKLQLTAVVPTVAVLAASIQTATVVWHDGETGVELRFAEGELRHLRRLPVGEPSAAPPLQQIVAVLATLGEDSMRFADAYGAAVTHPSHRALAAPLHASSSSRRMVSRGRALAAIAACTLMLVVAAAAPGISARATEQRARDQLAEIRASYAESLDAEGNLRQVSAALSEVSGVVERRRSALAFLDELNAVLPEGSALVALRIDSTGGSIVVLAPRAGAVVSHLDSIASVIGPEIVGPVTREIVGARELERVTVRFSFADAPATAFSSRRASTGAVSPRSAASAGRRGAMQP